MPTLEDELARQTKQQLQSIKEAGTSVAVLAERLDVEPATVYQLLQGRTTPSAKVLCNGCRNLNMSFRVDGHRIGASDFPLPAEQPPTTEIQLGLFEITASVAGGDLTMNIRKSPNIAVELGVRVAV